jgi:dipeptidyl aminopeptidase/acylaminoacyl peptidase
MRYIIQIAFWILSLQIAFAQKPALPLNAHESWPSVEQPGLSADGKFAFYKIHYESEDYNSGDFVVQSTENNWKMKFRSLDNAVFSQDSRELYGLLSGDTLLILNLYTHVIKKAAGVKNFRLIMQNKTPWLVSEPTGEDNRVVFSSTREYGSISFEQVNNYLPGPTGSVFIVQNQKTDGGAEIQTIKRLDLQTRTTQLIFEGVNCSDLIFDHTGSQLAFMVAAAKGNEIWLASGPEKKAVKIADNHSSGIAEGLSLNSGGLKFNSAGTGIFFSLKTSIRQNTENPNLVISSYFDPLLKGRVLGLTGQTNYVLDQQRNYNALFSFKAKKAIQLTFSDDDLIWQPDGASDKYVVLKETSSAEQIADDDGINRNNRYFVTSTETGERLPLKVSHPVTLIDLKISPSGRYITFFDPASLSYYSYSTKDRQLRILLSSTQDNLLEQTVFRNYPSHTFVPGIYCWYGDDEAMLIGTAFHVWQVDPTGKLAPKNIIAAGKSDRHIAYGITNTRFSLSSEKEKTILMSAFDLDTKGFALFKYKIGDLVNPEKLVFQNYYLPGLKSLYKYFSNGDRILKAGNSDSYLVKFERADSAPNFYFSMDLEKFKSISDLQPQEKYNWMTSELHKYTDSTGNQLEGILFKPENFDPKNQYPVVFNYYEEMSNTLNEFLAPDASAADINIAWLVSNGYLVFKANIHSEIGEIGDGALRSVNAAADYLSRFNWVNAKKLAVAGHSFGGYETNYIVTHTSRYAAAVSAAGMSDLTVEFHRAAGEYSWRAGTRNGQMKMGKSLIEDKENYIRNSPIFFADKVTTPLLMMNNPRDYNVEFAQGFSFFIELRALQKKVWLLSYKNEQHGIVDPVNALDYNTKLTQFLDHYLKDKPMPDWMKAPSAN